MNITKIFFNNFCSKIFSFLVEYFIILFNKIFLSNDLRNLIMYLLTNSQRAKSVNDLMPMVGARFYTALDNCMQRSDQLETELQRDIESARMFR